MDPLFSGSIERQRHINLGGSLPGSSTSSRLAAEARSSRQARDLARRREMAAIQVQKVWRGSLVRGEKRRWMRQQFKDMAIRQAALSNAHSFLDKEQAVQASVALAEAVRPHHFVQATRRRIKSIAEEEDQLLKVWCQAMIQPVSEASGSPLFIFLQREYATHDWIRAASVLLDVLHSRLLYQTAALASDTMLAFLGLYQCLWLNKQLDTLQRGHFDILGAVILSFPADRKRAASDGSMKLTAALLTLPFTMTLPTLEHLDEEDALRSVRAEYTDYFSRVILVIPRLPDRLPLPDFANLAATFPLPEIISRLQILTKTLQEGDQLSQPIALLANVVALCNQRIARGVNGHILASYLDVVTTLQNRISPSSLIAPRTLNDVVDQDTKKRLAVLPSVKHVSSILLASAKSPTVSRPAVYAFLCSLFFSWPEDIKTSIFNVVLYGMDVNSGIISTSLSSGFIRELWRGYVRSSALSRGLTDSSSIEIFKPLRQNAEHWPALALLSELYSRLLLTLGDDEFLPLKGNNHQNPTPSFDSLPGSSRVPGRTLSATNSSEIGIRNPLSMDEVLSFAQMLRNLAFSLYWDSDLAPSSSSVTRPASADLVPGLRLSFLALRDTATRLLQQLHARDARHRFTPDGFWLMAQGIDIDSFIESVLLEEDKIAQDDAEAQATANSLATAAADNLDDEDEDYHDRWIVGNPTSRHALPSKRHISTRKLAFISPRLAILNNLPFVLPFATRVEIFSTFVYRDARRNRIRQPSRFLHRKRVTIRRDHVSEDGMAQLNGLGGALKESIEIVFVDQFGMTEAGIDGGGVFKEFLTSLVREAFDTDRGLWKSTDQEELYPNPQSYAHQSEQLSWYAFLGRVLGKALYEGILVDVRFAPFFLSKCLGRRGLSHLDDLASLDSLDSELYRGLIYLKNYTGDVEQDLALNFTVTDEEFGERKSTELIPNGANIAVTNRNRLSYIFLVANYRLDAQIRAQCNAFFGGLYELIDPRWLRIFDQTELQELIKGSDSPIDIADLRANTVLSDYHEKDLTMTYLWETLESFDQPTRAQFLKFVTSCPSPPLLGFSQLNPRFCVRCSGDDEQRLPTSSTCVNLLKLPRYSSLETTREKILMAIQSGAGFDLS